MMKIFFSSSSSLFPFLFFKKLFTLYPQFSSNIYKNVYSW